MTSCLLVTHASRPFVEARGSLNSLESRFSAKGRLLNLPSFHTLPSVHEAVPFAGALTLWDVDRDARKRPALIGEYDPGYKIQSAAFRGNQLLVLGEDRIEVLTPGFRQKTITDPWLVGGHTIYCDKRGFAYATSAPANAILKIDVDAGKVVERIRLPDCYGIGYPLKESDDLRQHFVPTDLQPTHINSAVPIAEGLLVTLCIQGVIGVIGSGGRYREIVSGYRGCHGGRIDGATGLLYFTDSAAGIVWFVGYETGQIASRIKVASAWVHDADQIGKDLFAIALSDHNRIDVMDRASNEIVRSIDCHPFGASAMFVKAAALPDAWRPKRRSTPKGTPASSSRKLPVGKELLSDALNPIAWMGFQSVPASITPSLHIVCDDVRYEYVAEGQTHTLTHGEYLFEAEMVCMVGEASVGLLDDAQAWVAQLSFDSTSSVRSTRFSIPATTSVTVVVTGHNSRRPCPIAVEVKRLSLKRSAMELDAAADATGNDENRSVSQAVVHRRVEMEALQAEINKRDSLLASAQEGLSALQDEINRRDELLKEANSRHNDTHDHLQSEVDKRDALLKEERKGIDRLQLEVNRRDELLEAARRGLEQLQAEVNSRDELLQRVDSRNKEVQAQLQSEINKRDALLATGQEGLERLQAEITKRDELLKTAHEGIECLQAEVNKRDALLNEADGQHRKVHDLLQAEVTKRDALLNTMQNEIERIQTELIQRDALLVSSHEGLERLQAEVNMRDELLKTAHQGHEYLQSEINKRDTLLVASHEGLERLQTEVNTRDELLKTAQHELDRLQAEVRSRDNLLANIEKQSIKVREQLQSEVNKRDELLRTAHQGLEHLQAEINKRDALLVASHGGLERLQTEVNTRDELLNTAQHELDRLQVEMNSRDELLLNLKQMNMKACEQLQAEVNKRDELLQIAHQGLEHLQGEVNKRDVLIRETHDHLQTEVSTRDRMLSELQRKLNEGL
jgi:peptidoglycan hydrolase CwlO-like protein